MLSFNTIRPLFFGLKLAFFFLFLSLNEGIAQEKFTFSGYVKDGETGETMIGAQVAFPGLKSGVVTNTYGFFSISLPSGKYFCRISFMGFDEWSDTLDLSKNISKEIKLYPTSKMVTEVVVTSENANKNTESTDMGTITLDVYQMKTLPAFLGEVDIIKTIQLLPGVASANEGAQGFYVRGGGPDQNLVLLDEATVYNASHLFGFFSVFNADAIKNVNLIKGGMPAQFGGRLASVLEVNMNEGNNQRFSAEGGVGVLSSRLTLEGPIVKDKGSFIVSARRTYIDLLMKAFVPETSGFYGSSYFFHDYTAKLNYRLSKRDKIYLSGYFGKDKFVFNNQKDDFRVEMPWGNATGVIRWNHVFGEKLFMNLSGVFTDYNFQFKSGQDDFRFSLYSGVRDFGTKLDFSYYPAPRHEVKFGAAYTYHIFTPTSVSAESDDVVFNTGDIQRIYGHEGAVYVQDDFDVTTWWKVNAGLRYSWYQHVGPFTRFIKTPGQVTDSTIQYGKNDPIQFYHGLEPRISTRFLLKDKSSIKAGFNQVNQYIHLASLSAVSLPTDIWFPSTDIAAPQRGWQASIGYFRNFMKGMFETSVEVYYKGMKNLIEYREGALPSDNVNDNPDNLLVFGKGRSYGVEFFIKKNLGKLTGWIGYTLAKTERLFLDLQPTYFPAKYDRRHDLSVALNYKLSERWTFGGVFVYASGNTMTLPVAWYLNQDQIMYEYGERNSTRMPAYHRLDFSATWYDKPTKMKRDKATGEPIEVKKRFRSNISMSVYNVYNRQNPYFVYVDTDGTPAGGDFQISLKQVSLFPIIPSFTWNFKF
jgi:hypothetical protein